MVVTQRVARVRQRQLRLVITERMCMFYTCFPGDDVTMLSNDSMAHAQRSSFDDVTTSTDQSQGGIVGQCDVTLSRDRLGGRSPSIRSS